MVEVEGAGAYGTRSPKDNKGGSCASPASGGPGQEEGGGGGGRGGRGAHSKAGGRVKVWTNFPLSPSPVSPSCKIGFYSGCFLALCVIYSKYILMDFPWKQKYLPRQKFRKNTEETKLPLNEVQSTSVSIPSFPEVGASLTEPNKLQDKLREPNQNPLFSGN